MKTIFREYGRIIVLKRGYFALIVLGICGGIGFDLAVPLFYKNIANGLTETYSPETLAMLLDNLLTIGALYTGVWLSWRVLEFAIIPFEAGGIRLLDQRCFAVLLKQRYSFFENNFSGSLVKRANRFIRAFEAIMDWVIFQLFGNLLAITISFVIFYLQQPEFALYFLAWVVLFIGWSVGFSIWKLKFDERVSSMDSKLGGAYSDGITNISIVKSFALEQQENNNVSDLAEEAYRKRRIAWILMFVAFAVQGILSMGIELILVYLMIDKWQTDTFAVGEFVLFQSILLLLIHRLWDFGRYFRNFFTAVADAREMAQVFDETDLEEDTPQATAQTITKGAIRFDAVHFDYHRTDQKNPANSTTNSTTNSDTNSDKNKPPPATQTIPTIPTTLFEDFDLTIQAGEKIALVGHSGSGKTSLTKLLFRFVEPQGGAIAIDGIALQDFTLASLRRQISLVPQQPELFHRSIRDNMTLGKAVSDEQLRDAARRARALGFIEKLPEGFETLVGERGVKLSGGEKQRVAIARAFLEDAPIVVLDEATSALDSLTEQEIQTAIFELIEDKTALVIAHRLATILRMDRIIVMENGKIIEQGTHETLLKQQGRYQAMWQHQSGEFIQT